MLNITIKNFGNYMKHKKGFTLIELLVVVLIIAILAAIALPKYRIAEVKTELMQGVTFVKMVSDAQRRFHLATGRYADNLNELDISIASDVISGDGRGVSYKKFTCSLNHDPYFSDYCYYIPYNGNVVIEKYYDSNAFRCWAHTTDISDDNNKACQSISGTSAPTGQHSTLGNLYWF